MEGEKKTVLDELNKGCEMGIHAIEAILERAHEGEFKELLLKLNDEYHELAKEIWDYAEEEPKDLSAISKTFSWYGLQMRMITDDSDSKLSELIMQGLNMGIIEGRKFLNAEKDKDLHKLLSKFISIQEKYVEKFKEYL
ncbi:MAG: hypothetical protein IJ193_04865 [Bacilli bacterium]|nr:hypothetical protein [Bacilli bacterium]